MTDRGSDALRVSPDTFAVGPSRMHWDGRQLLIDIDEITVPHMDRLRGSVRLTPSALSGVELPLRPDGSHVWRPFAPTAEIEVAFDRPGWQWRGHGYFDANFGTRALEADFRTWTWARLPVPGGTICLYDAELRDGPPLSVALKFDADGRVDVVSAPKRTPLSRSRWALRRETRCDPDARPVQVKSMLDAPFYCRSVVRTVFDGVPTVGVHEALDLDRFASPWLKPMLAIKVPRRRRWSAAR